MVGNSDQELANDLRRQRQEARASRSLNVSENNIKIVGNKRPAQTNKIITKDRGNDKQSAMGSLRHQARQNMSVSLATTEMVAVNALGTPVRFGTDRLLAQSWLNLIPSWGLTLLYINLHVFMRLVAGSEFFSKLGHEWSRNLPGLNVAISGNKEAKKTLKTFGDNIGIFEAMLLILLDLLALFIILAVAVLVVLLVWAIVDPLSFLGYILALLFP